MNETTCSQAGCQIETSGRCLEGFDPPQNCPYYAQPEQVQDETSLYSAQELVDLPSGEALTERQAAEVTRDDKSNVIIIAGPIGSGKTTILTSLFEAFLEAPFANYLFRGSRTLVGFERRCHLGREESGNETADTSHTSVREGVVFLHLDLSSKDEGNFQHTHLLLADISGELFRRLRDSSDAAQDLSALRRANHVCLAIDGEKIVRPEQRQVAYNDSRSILRSIIESEMLAPDCVIDVAFTKWDVIVSAMESDKAGELTDFMQHARTALSTTARDFRIHFHELAARPPKNAKVPFAHGLPTLLRSWMGYDQAPDERPAVFLPAGPSREFAHFTNALMASKKLEDRYVIHRL
jgi:Double-GTPase 2